MSPGRIVDEKGGSSETDNVVSELPTVPITRQRKPFRQDPDDIRLSELGLARANVAATYDTPEGSREGDYSDFAEAHKHQTVLQQHLAFFDTDNDGIIWPIDTFWGFMRLGFGLVLSIVAVFIIHPPFSWPTNPGTGLRSWIQDPFFRIHINNIHRTKHGSDSGSYDTEGRFIPQKFEDMFSKYANGKEYMTWDDIKGMMKGQRLLMDPFGWSAAFFEWGATYYMLWPADGRMSKEDARSVFDGTLFYKVEDRRKARRQSIYTLF